jgi:cyanate permease
VLGGFVTPWAIGLIRDRTGDFRIGEIGVASLALLVSMVFYVVGGWQEAAALKEVQA